MTTNRTDEAEIAFGRRLIYIVRCFPPTGPTAAYYNFAYGTGSGQHGRNEKAEALSLREAIRIYRGMEKPPREFYLSRRSTACSRSSAAGTRPFEETVALFQECMP